MRSRRRPRRPRATSSTVTSSASTGRTPITARPDRRAVLWDLDGTLADSKEFHWRAWRDVMAAGGRPISVSDFEASFGQRNEEILTGWLGEEATPARIRAIGDDKEERYRALVVSAGLTPLPGADEWVRSLHADGWLQVIASSAPRQNIRVMRRVLGFEDLIEEFVGAEDVRNGKPAPDVFLAAASRVGAAHDLCIVVEDAAAGVEAARRAGMRCIGVGDGGANADVTVRSLADLAEGVFEALLRR